MRAPAAQLRLLRRWGGEAATPVRPPPARARAAARPVPWAPGAMWPVLLACLAIAALTLLLPSTPTYDPWAWILWGREIAHLDLVTTAGPSWKPLPILFTIPFSLFGSAAPYLWLVVARAGGLLACVMTYRVAARFVRGDRDEPRDRVYTVLAGVAAALALFSSFKFVRDTALGNSESLLAGLVLWAFERHLDGRRDHALYLGVAAALLRPEVWPFLGLYGLWLWFREPRLRLRMGFFALLIPALWFLPEWWGSGDAFRASARASHPNPQSIAFAKHPALELGKRSWKVVIAPVKGGVVVAVAYALWAWFRDRRSALGRASVRFSSASRTLVLLIGGCAWFALVAIMTEKGYAGNQRYLIVFTATVSVLGGIGAARVLQGVERLITGLSGSERGGAFAAAGGLVVALVASTPFIAEKAHNTARVTGGLRYEARIWSEFKTVLDRVGGPARLRECGGVFSGPFQTQMIAWQLHLHGASVAYRPTPPPGVLFRTRTVPRGPLVTTPTDPRYRQVTRYGKWRVLTVPPTGQRPGRQSCPRARPHVPTAPPPPGGLPFAHGRLPRPPH
jgi:hypothetical protein